MGKAKNWAYTDLTGDSTLVLTIGDDNDEVKDDFEVVQVTCSFTLNQIPQASCLLAMGRDAYNVQRRAKIHEAAARLNTLKKAVITFFPKGEANIRGDLWPKEPKVIFEGLFLGFGYRKIRGQVQIVVQLAHWLLNMGMSSSLSATSHPSNPGSLVFPSVLPTEPDDLDPVEGSGGETGLQAVIMPSQYGFKNIANLATQDMWGAIKTFLCLIAGQDKWEPVKALCVEADRVKNDEAKIALSRIEGPGGKDCTLNYISGLPLPMQLGAFQVLADGVAESFNTLFAAQFANHTLWDAMIAHLLTPFGMSIVPVVDRAVVIAHTPGFREPWKVEVGPDEYSSLDHNPAIAKPLRGVVLETALQSDAGANFGLSGNIAVGLGGCYFSRSAQDIKGTILVEQPPEWLSAGSFSALRSGASTGKAGKSNSLPGQAFGTLSELYNQWARFRFIEHNLRTRTARFSGILRFDIAPGSHLKLISSPEQFLGSQDALAETLYGMVQRVSIAINAESQQASTSFQLVHVRSEKENGEERTSIDYHPIYDQAVVKGLPLVDDYLFTA